jgi:hypothetical protein
MNWWKLSGIYYMSAVILFMAAILKYNKWALISITFASFCLLLQYRCGRFTYFLCTNHILLNWCLWNVRLRTRSGFRGFVCDVSPRSWLPFIWVCLEWSNLCRCAILGVSYWNSADDGGWSYIFGRSFIWHICFYVLSF